MVSAKGRKACPQSGRGHGRTDRAGIFGQRFPDDASDPDAALASDREGQVEAGIFGFRRAEQHGPAAANPVIGSEETGPRRSLKEAERFRGDARALPSQHDPRIGRETGSVRRFPGLGKHIRRVGRTDARKGARDVSSLLGFARVETGRSIIAGALTNKDHLPRIAR